MQEAKSILTCNCRENNIILFGVQKPEDVLSLAHMKLIRRHPTNHNKYYYQCAACGQYWEKQAQPHPYGYSENWKKLTNLPSF